MMMIGALGHHDYKVIWRLFQAHKLCEVPLYGAVVTISNDAVNGYLGRTEQF